MFLIPTRAAPDAAADEVSLFLVERSAGVEASDEWKGTGLRGSSSGPVAVDALVPDENLMGAAGTADEHITTDMFNLLLLSHAVLYSGIADEAFALATRRASARRFAHTGTALAGTTLWQSKLGELSAELTACRSLIDMAAEQVESSARGQLFKESLAAKLLACRAARRSTDLALQLFGGSGYNVGTRVELLWRDARAGSLMRPSDEVTSLILGRLATGRTPFELCCEN